MATGAPPHRLVPLALAEFLGTFLLVSLGLSAAATAAVTSPATSQMGSGLALVVGLYVTMGASGGHINPAVSTAMFVVKKMKLADYLVYQAAQYAGGFLAAVLVCCFFYPPLLDFAVESGPLTAGNATVSATAEMEAVYITHAHQTVSMWRALASEVFATGAFILTVRAITDPSNAGPPTYLQPPMIAVTVLTLTKCTAPLSGCVLNPARDLPSRVVVAVFQLICDGSTTGLFSLEGSSGFVAPCLGPYLGAIVGSWLYELCIGKWLKYRQCDGKNNSIESSCGSSSSSSSSSQGSRRNVKDVDNDPMDLEKKQGKLADNCTEYSKATTVRLIGPIDDGTESAI